MIEQKHDDAIVVADQAAYAALFNADSPAAVLERAQELVQYVGALIEKRRKDYIADIKGKKYAMYTYWAVYDLALGITNDQSPVEPFLVATKPDVEAYRCRTTLFLPDGRQLGASEAVVADEEPPPMGESKWRTHALVSKTQTRSFVKTHRMSMSLIPLLDGLEPIAYDEVVQPPLEFPGDRVDLEHLPADVEMALSLLRDKSGGKDWGTRKAKAWLAKFYTGDVLDEAAALAGLNREIDKTNMVGTR